MPTSNIQVVEIGIPGPPGAGVSPAEKASFVTLSGTNVFTGTDEFRKDATAAVVVSKGPATTDRTLVVDSTNKEVEIWNAGKLRVFSDAGVTEVASIDGAGNAQFDGTMQVDGGAYKGEQLWWPFMVDGGGSALTSGVKIRYLIPYNCQIVSDGSAAWEVGLDQTGSIGFDLWVDTYANYPPTNADRISGSLGSQNPRVSSAVKASSTALTGWTVNLVKGTWLFIAIDSVTTATWATLGLHVKKT